MNEPTRTPATSGGCDPAIRESVPMDVLAFQMAFGIVDLIERLRRAEARLDAIESAAVLDLFSDAAVTV